MSWSRTGTRNLKNYAGMAVAIIQAADYYPPRVSDCRICGKCVHRRSSFETPLDTLDVRTPAWPCRIVLGISTSCRFNLNQPGKNYHCPVKDLLLAAVNHAFYPDLSRDGAHHRGMIASP